MLGERDEMKQLQSTFARPLSNAEQGEGTPPAPARSVANTWATLANTAGCLTRSICAPSAPAVHATDPGMIDIRGCDVTSTDARRRHRARRRREAAVRERDFDRLCASDGRIPPDVASASHDRDVAIAKRDVPADVGWSRRMNPAGTGKTGRNERAGCRRPLGSAAHGSKQAPRRNGGGRHGLWRASLRA
ncbi:unnamed protein product [Lampetra fluviatilis]